MGATAKPRFCTLLLVACLASPLPAQEAETQENRAVMLKNAPSVSRDGKVTFTLTAPKASAVTLSGDWGGGRTQMTSAANRDNQAHEKGSGFGFITFDPVKKTSAIDSFRFLIDPSDGNASNQFPGWPVTIHQTENRGENRLD